MSSRLPGKSPKHLTSPAQFQNAELMIRDLIRHVKSNAEHCGSADPDEVNVLLDTEVDGVRCLLVNLEPPNVEGGDNEGNKAFLSPREEEIARMVAAGYPNKTIAAVLDISCWTVGTHLRRVFAKLGVGSRAAMVASLLKKGNLKYPTGPV